MLAWPEIYLQLAAADLGIGPETMRHVAPLGWEHLSLTGDYAWDAEGAHTRRAAATQDQGVAARGIMERSWSVLICRTQR